MTGPGNRLCDYVLLEPMRQTSFGTESRAGRIGQSGPVRILSLDPVFSAQEFYASRLLAGLRLAVGLDHQNALPTLETIDANDADGRFHVVTELVWGRTLDAVFARRRQVPLALPPPHCLEIVAALCAALHHAAATVPSFAGSGHGLVLPSQVFVTFDGEVKLAGFGLAGAGGVALAVLDSEERRCLAPEGFGLRADVYALGSLLFECLTGTPFGKATEDPGPRLAEVSMLGSGHPLPPQLASIMERCLSSAPLQRLGSPIKLASALQDVILPGYLGAPFGLGAYMLSLFKEELVRETAMRPPVPAT